VDDGEERAVSVLEEVVVVETGTTACTGVKTTSVLGYHTNIFYYYCIHW
jgi:hypothetical protein